MAPSSQKMQPSIEPRAVHDAEKVFLRPSRYNSRTNAKFVKVSRAARHDPSIVG
jgi:hypothetical protein